VDPIYIAVGEPSTIYASPDAKSWTPEDIGANTLGDVAYGAGSFVITAYGGSHLHIADSYGGNLDGANSASHDWPFNSCI
jgi:hypothetical protein